MPAVELAEGGEIRFGSIRLEVLHTPGHTEGSVCLLEPTEGRLFSGDTLFAGSFGRVDLPGGSPEAMVESLDRLRGFDDGLRVLPGHGGDDDDRAGAAVAGLGRARGPPADLTRVVTYESGPTCHSRHATLTASI